TLAIEGYPLSASASDDSESPYQIPFQMTMFVTDYHEYSLIAETRFPGVPAQSISVLNAELQSSRKKFVSTGAQVRDANLNYLSSTQIPKGNSALAALRGGISAINDATTVVS